MVQQLFSTYRREMGNAELNLSKLSSFHFKETYLFVNLLFTKTSFSFDKPAYFILSYTDLKSPEIFLNIPVYVDLNTGIFIR